MNTIDPGDLRHRVFIYQRAAGGDASGERSTWRQIVAAWGAIKLIKAGSQFSGGKFAATGKQVTTSLYQVTMRAQSVPVTPGMRISLKGVDYLITSVDDEEGVGRYLQLTVEKERG